MIARPQYSEKLASMCVKPSGVVLGEPHHLVLKAERIRPAYVTPAFSPRLLAGAEPRRTPSTLSSGCTFCKANGASDSILRPSNGNVRPFQLISTLLFGGPTA